MTTERLLDGLLGVAWLRPLAGLAAGGGEGTGWKAVLLPTCGASMPVDGGQREEELLAQCSEGSKFSDGGGSWSGSSSSEEEEGEGGAAASARRWLKSERLAKHKRRRSSVGLATSAREANWHNLQAWFSLSRLELNDLERDLLTYILLECTDHEDLICHVARCAAVCRRWRSIVTAKGSPTARLLWAPVPRELKLLDLGHSFARKKLIVVRRVRQALRRALVEGKLCLSAGTLSAPGDLSAGAGIALGAAMQALVAHRSAASAPPPPATTPEAPANGNQRPLRVEDALQYLERVKLAFNHSSAAYENFLRIMRDYKDGTTDTPGVIHRVCTLLQGHTQLILQFNEFLPQGYKIHEAQLDGGVRLSEIHLSHSLLTPAAMPSLATLLMQQQQVGGFTERGGSSMLAVLRLEHNPHLGDAGLGILAEALPLTLTSLVLDDTGCTCVGLQAVAKQLPLLTRLVKLSLQSNIGIKQRGWETLGRTLAQMPSLTELRLRGCSCMKSAGAGAVVAALTSASPPPLALVDFDSCGIGSTSAEMLVSDLLSSPHLKKVVLSGNRMNRRMRAALTAAAATMGIELIAPWPLARHY